MSAIWILSLADGCWGSGSGSRNRVFGAPKSRGADPAASAPPAASLMNFRLDLG